MGTGLLEQISVTLRQSPRGGFREAISLLAWVRLVGPAALMSSNSLSSTDKRGISLFSLKNNIRSSWKYFVNGLLCARNYAGPGAWILFYRKSVASISKCILCFKSFDDFCLIYLATFISPIIFQYEPLNLLHFSILQMLLSAHLMLGILWVLRTQRPSKQSSCLMDFKASMGFRQ